MIFEKQPTLRDVWDGIRTQPGRVGLSFFAVSIGIVALTILLAITSGLREKARLLVRDLGAHVVAIMPSTASSDASFDLTGRHAALLSANLDGRVISSIRRNQVKPEGWDQTLTVISTDEALAALRQWKIEAGRFLDRTDIASGDRHAVISHSLCRRFNWDVGAIMILQGLPFEVVGVLETGAGASESDAPDERIQFGEDCAFIPHSVYAPWSAGARPETRPLDAIFVQGSEDESMDHLVRTCRNILAAPDLSVADLNWVTPETLLRSIRRMQQTIRFSVGSIAVLCLVLGGTTLMSLMLANVRDRVTEIGLRRALGAQSRDVWLLFVLEACAITVAAALAGTASAALILGLAEVHLPVPLRLGAWTFLIPVLASLGLGVIFSYWPAQLAARIAPADALRNE